VKSSLDAIRSFAAWAHGQRVDRDAIAHLDVRVKESTRLAFMENVFGPGE
jgi:hypothetical protein